MRRAAAALSWASAFYVLIRVGAFYFAIGSTRRHHIESAAFLFVLLLLPLVVLQRAPENLTSPESEDGGRVPFGFVGVAFAAASLMLYWPLLAVGLFADDYVILDAAREGRLTVWRELFRPVIFLVWRPLIGLTASPGALMHALNILLHGVNAALLALLAQRLFGRRSSGLIAGALFLCCPAGLEAVAWPSGLQDVLMTTFVLLFLVLATSERQTWWIGSLAIVTLIAGLLTKETAIAAPLLAALAGAAAATSDRRRSIWTIAVISMVAVAGFLAIRLALLPLPVSYGADFTRYGVKELLVRPFATLAVPLREWETRSAPAVPIGAVAAVVVALRVAAARWDRHARRFHVALIGGAMVLAAVAPVLSYFYVDPDLLGSRYLYLAQSGWVLSLAAILETAGRGRKAVYLPVLASLACFWLIAGHAHVNLWREAAQARDRILGAAAATNHDCSSWAVYRLPPAVRGVPLFVNGFPEAARTELTGRIRVAPSTLDPGECRLTWNGEQFVRD